MTLQGIYLNIWSLYEVESRIGKDEQKIKSSFGNFEITCDVIRLSGFFKYSLNIFTKSYHPLYKL